MATEDLTFRFNVTGNAVPQFKAVQKQVSAVDRQVKRATNTVRAHANQYNRTSVATNKWAKGALQQAGFQIGDYAVQVANGTSKMQAFGQQGAQLLGIFGPVGAVLGAAVAIFSAVGVAAEKSGKQISDMGSALGVLQEPLSSIVASVKSIGGVFGDVFPNIVENIDTALIAAGLFGAYLGVKYVAQSVAARVSTVSLTASLFNLGVAYGRVTAAVGATNTVTRAYVATTYALGVAFGRLKKIFMTFLPVAVLAGLAKLIEIFLRLVKGAGDFGNALSLLKDLASEVFVRMTQAAGGFSAYIKGLTSSVVAQWNYMLLDMSEKTTKFFASFGKTLMETGVPGLSQIGAAMVINSGQVKAAMGEYETIARESTSAANEAFGEAATKIKESITPLESWQALKDAVAAGTSEVKIFGDAAVEANEKAGGAASRTAEKMNEVQNKIKGVADSIAESFGDAFMSVVEGTKSAGDAFRDMARAIIKELFDIFVVKQITGFISRAISGGPIGSLIGAATASFAGGGYTGNAPRAGGLDGKGGFMAMMHPRETVVDHTKGQSLGGNIVVNQTINVSTGVQQTVRNEIKSLMPQIAEGAKTAVVDAKRRGGSYGRSFA